MSNVLKKINILIFGYYNRQNWGDDIFEHVFKTYIFEDEAKYNLIFKNVDELDSNIKEYKSIDKVIIGGGDIINEYFFNDDRINTFRKYFTAENTNQVPIYFVGIGLSYDKMIRVLDIGDFFYMRNEIDYKLASERFGVNYCGNIPDLAFNLNNTIDLKNYNKPARKIEEIKKIGLCLPNTWLNALDDNTLFLDICNFIKILSSSYQLYLIPFNTSDDINNSDIILNNKIEKQIGNCSGNVFYIKPSKNDDNTYNSFTVNDMIDYFKNIDIVFGSRYHSIILSIITNTPFISIYSTPKIFNLMNEMKVIDTDIEKLFIKLPLDSDNKPLTIDTMVVVNTLKYVIINYNNIISTLDLINSNYIKKLHNMKIHLNGLINSASSARIFRQPPPQYITKRSRKVLVETTVKNVLKKIFTKISLRDIDAIMSGKSLISLLPRNSRVDSYKTQITEEILWSVTNDPNGPYYYGLYDNIFTSDFLEQVHWLIDDYYQKYYYKHVNICNVEVVNKNFQGVHRSGWQYIVDNLVIQLNESNETIPFIIDTYIDKTFHWNSSFYISKGIIPYIKPWIGFIHHTYSDYNNDYNCVLLFENKIFLESLKTCKCLIVLTQYLSTQIKKTLDKLNINIPVVNLIHPTENTDLLFNWNTFIKNDNKQIVQIGSWLRDMFSIYRVELPITSIITKKCILKNKNSSNYFPPPNFLDTLKSQLNYDKQLDGSVTICHNAFTNMHVKGLYDSIVDMHNSVTVIEHLDNYNYDKLLSENIVFLNLKDASATNTLIECILRNTPIIVNPITPVIEILGADYPLYYNNYYEISKLLDNQDLLYDGYMHICNMDKSSFNITQFITGMNDIITKHVKN